MCSFPLIQICIYMSVVILTTFVVIAICVASPAVSAAAATIPGKLTPVYTKPIVEVQVGRYPPRTLEMYPDFGEDRITLIHPIDGIEAPVPPLDGSTSVTQLPEGSVSLSIGEHDISAAPLLLNAAFGAPLRDGPHRNAGILGLSPQSYIARNYVIQIKPATFAHPDGFRSLSYSGSSIALQPRHAFLTKPDDIVIPLKQHGIRNWEVSPYMQYIAGRSLDALVTMTPFPRNAICCPYLFMSDKTFEKVFDSLRDAGQTVHIIYTGVGRGTVFIPCRVDGDERPDPVARLLSVRLDAYDGIHDYLEWHHRSDNLMYINIRRQRDADFPSPPPPSVTVAGVDHCPTLLVISRTAGERSSFDLYPQMLTPRVQTFLDGANQRVILRRSTVSDEAPLVVEPIAMLPTFDIPDAVAAEGGPIRFKRSASPDGWTLVSPRPKRIGGGRSLYVMKKRHGRVAARPPIPESELNYPGRYYLVGDGTIDMSNPAMFSLPISTEGTGPRCRITIHRSNDRIEYVLTPVDYQSLMGVTLTTIVPDATSDEKAEEDTAL